MATKSISQLDTQATANETDLFEVAIVDANSASGYASKKESAAAIADAIVGDYTYPLLMPNMQAKTITGAINQLLANFAAVYDSTATYIVGDICTYNGQLYKCNAAISTAEAFDPTKWDAINLADNIGSGGDMYNYSTTEQVVGRWVDGKPVYGKVYSGLSIICASVDTWYSTNILWGDIKKIVESSVIDINGQVVETTVGNITSSNIKYIGLRTSVAGRTFTDIIIRYTKTTD